MSQVFRNTIHYSELQSLIPGSRHADEWEVYRREAGRLIADGHEGQYVLIHCGQIIGVWSTYQGGRDAGQKLGLSDPFLYQIRTEEPILKIGYNKLCRN